MGIWDIYELSQHEFPCAICKFLKTRRKKETHLSNPRFFDLYPHWSQVNWAFEWFSDMCFLSRWSKPQVKLHSLHFKNLSCTILTCCFKSEIIAYDLGHCWHWKIFSPWTRCSWQESRILFANVFGQNEHLPVNSVSSVSTRAFSFGAFLRFFAAGGLSLEWLKFLSQKCFSIKQ